MNVESARESTGRPTHLVRILLSVALMTLALLSGHAFGGALAPQNRVIAGNVNTADISPAPPRIDSASFSGEAGNYTVTFTGSGFGFTHVPLPFMGDLPNFRIGDSAQLAESGYLGDAYFLTYLEWTDTNVTVSNFRGRPGEAITVALWNQSSRLAATWGGTVPPDGSTIQITSVNLAGTGKNLRIEVNGSGFGPAPPELSGSPFVGNLNDFRFFDFRAHCGMSSSLFAAGFQGWGRDRPTSVFLRYESWSDRKIVITGFAGTYGRGCAEYEEGDPVAIVVWNTDSSSLEGPQAAWGGSANDSSASAAQPETETNAPTAPPRKLANEVAATRDVDCLGVGSEQIRNNTHGTVRIVRGTGDFDKIDSGHKNMAVGPGADLQGTVTIEALNRGPGFAVAPIIVTPSWGDHSTSWRLIGYLPVGGVTHEVKMSLRAPLEPGTYHILFAFQLELQGGNVASGTNWSGYGNVWNDGNDIAEFNDSQIQSAQRWGCAVDSWLMPEGPQLFYVPADAITLEVHAPTSGLTPRVAPKAPEQAPTSYSWLTRRSTTNLPVDESVITAPVVN